jgi:hypothetical protein
VSRLWLSELWYANAEDIYFSLKRVLYQCIKRSLYCDIFAESWGSLLENGPTMSDATIEHVTPQHVTNGSTHGNGVFNAVSADSYVMQQRRNFEKPFSQRVCAEAICGETKQKPVSPIPCAEGVEYLHRIPASSRRWRKGNPVPGGITGPPCSWGI